MIRWCAASGERYSNVSTDKIFKFHSNFKRIIPLVMYTKFSRQFLMTCKFWRRRSNWIERHINSTKGCNTSQSLELNSIQLVTDQSSVPLLFGSAHLAAAWRGRVLMLAGSREVRRSLRVIRLAGRAKLHATGYSFSADHLTTRVFSPTSPTACLCTVSRYALCDYAWLDFVKFPSHATGHAYPRCIPSIRSNTDSSLTLI
jgi:hypothetical protein